MLFFGGGVSFTPAKDMPSLAGKVILVTGGNTGLGKQAVLDFARYGKPAKILLASRSAEKARAAIDDIRQSVPDDAAAVAIVPLVLDLASFESVKAAAREFVAQSDRLDILMLNAGVMATSAGQTKEGYEVQFGTNHLGHALLTKLLLPTLRRTRDLPGADVRVVVLSSLALGAATRAGFLGDWVKSDGAGIWTWTRYGHAKLANALFARELAKREERITAVSVHPGSVNTGLMAPFSTGNGFLGRVAGAGAKILFPGPEVGARNQEWAAVGNVENGEYYTPVGIKGTGFAVGLVRDDELAKRLWEWTEEQLKGQAI